MITAKKEAPSADEEPTIEVPLKKGTKAVKIRRIPLRFIKVVGGGSDAVAYRQAITVAGRLIDDGLWDGESQIRFDDMYATAKKIKGLSDKEIGSLFTLEEFVQTGDGDRVMPPSLTKPDPGASRHHRPGLDCVRKIMMAQLSRYRVSNAVSTTAPSTTSTR